MKVKKLLLIPLACIMVCIPIILSGCENPWDIKREENGFYYVLCDKYGDYTKSRKKAVSAIILDRVDTEESVDELTIPQELGGFPVKKIGAYYRPLEGQPSDYRIDCTNVGKIIINHACELDFAFSNLSGELVINADVSLSSSDQFVLYSYRTAYKAIRFNVELRSLTDYETWAALWERDRGVAADRQLKMVEFAADGDQTTYAYVVQINSSVECPQAPTKSGYTFVGWYSDVNYENEWDFATDKVMENTTLYAKWIAE